jgi:zinc transport system ATP-binding protein
MSKAPVIEVRDVSFSYQSTPVLENVNLTIYDRETVCMVGPNGGGKTTLLRLLLGQLRPTRGEVLVFGQPPQQTRLRMGYMPQRSQYDPLFPVTVMDVVLMGRLGQPGLRGWLGWYGGSDRRAAGEALEQVHMADAAKRPFAALSGGQRQRVLIARALCCHPELLLLDEPMANVDSLVEARLFDELRQLGLKMTIVLVSHDLGFVTNLVERVICVNRQAVAHPTSQLTADLIRDMYGGDVNLVRHGDVMCHREHVREGGEQGAGSGEAAHE